MILEVGQGKKYATVSAAITAAVDGDTIKVEPGVYMDQPFLVNKHNLKLICDGGLDNPAIFGMTLVKSVNANGVVNYWAKGIDKGICTIKAGIYNTYIEGFEFYNAKIGGDYNGAGIRGQGIGLHVHKCKFHDNQNGVMTSAQLIDGKRAGYVFITNCVAYKNGFDGLQHNFYIGPALRQVVTNTVTNDSIRGHAIKFHQGGGVAIAFNNTMIDSDVSAPNEPRTSCAIDSTSGHLIAANNLIRKVHTLDKETNLSKANYHSNHRSVSEIGNSYVFINNSVHSTVNFKGAYVRVDDMPLYKDGSGVPPGTIGFIGNNVFSCEKTSHIADNGATVEDGINYNTVQLSLPVGVNVADNLFSGSGQVNTPSPLALDTQLNPGNLLVFVEELINKANHPLAKERIQASLNSLKAFEVEFPITMQPPAPSPAPAPTPAPAPAPGPTPSTGIRLVLEVNGEKYLVASLEKI